jgi:hypothetical protein
MSLAIDSQVSGGVSLFSEGTTGALTAAFNNVAGTYLLVGIAWGKRGSLTGAWTVTGVTYGGVSMSEIEATKIQTDSDHDGVVFYELVNPPTGSNDIVVSTNGVPLLDANSTIIASPISFTGQHATPLISSNCTAARREADGNSISLQTPINTTTGNIAVWVAGCGGTITAINQTQSALKNVNTNSTAGNSGLNYASGNGSQLTGTFTHNTDWAQIAVVEVQAAATGSAASGSSISTATAVGRSVARAVASSSAAATATSVGRSVARAVASASATSTATASSREGSTASASSTSTATAVGRSVARAVASASASATAAAVGIGQGRRHLRLSGDGRYLVDPSNNPVFLTGNCCWILPTQVTFAEAQFYIDTRASQGYNFLMMMLLDRSFADNAPANENGDQPFTTPGDFTTPNEDYFAHFDAVIDYAESKGLDVGIAPLYLGFNGGSEGWESFVSSMTAQEVEDWGRFVGARYKTRPNIVWIIGGDRNPGTDVKNKMTDLVNGIKAEGDIHLITAHGNRNTNSREIYPSVDWIDINAVYTEDLNPASESATAYALTPFKPCFLIEDYYGNQHSITALGVRREGYYAVFGGCTLGQLYADSPTVFQGSISDDNFADIDGLDWLVEITNAGARQRALIGRLMNSRRFHLFEPDLTDDVLTAGESSGANLCVATKASDDSTVMVYTPTGGTVTVDLGQLSGTTLNAYWYNPRTPGVITLAGPFDTSDGETAFAPPDSNDWVLVIDDAAQGFGLPGGIVEAVASASVTTTAQAVGRSVARGVASASAAAPTTAVGRAERRSVAAAASTSTATAIGRSEHRGVASSSSTSTAVSFAAGSSLAVSSGVASVVGVGAATTRSAAAASASASASAVGASRARAVASASAASTATGTGRSHGRGVASGVSTSTVSSVGRSEKRAVASASTTSTAAAVSAGTMGDAVSTSTSGAAAVGRSLARAVATSSSAASALGFSAASGILTVFVRFTRQTYTETRSRDARAGKYTTPRRRGALGYDSTSTLYVPGEVAGFSQQQAADLVEQGSAVYV